jgi:glucosamine--fructose-6-phosphate aminotransferase (isomerizing)
MVSFSSLHRHTLSLPELVRFLVADLVPQLSRFTFHVSSIQHIFITGCGDSHFAGRAAELAFEQLAGLPCQPMTAMQFSRYTVGYLPEPAAANLVLAISASGQVSRTVEALELARQQGATTVAITGNPDSPLGLAAGFTLLAAVPPLSEDEAGLVVPGLRSYLASLLALYLIAIQLGEGRGHLSQADAEGLRQELSDTADLIEQTIALNGETAAQLADAWNDADYHVLCGAGPNYGTALFGAAKLLEASGDPAIGQDTEEWAHLEYFGRDTPTPTFLISAGGWDEDRVLEVATAAKAIGRRVAIIAPAGSGLAQTMDKDALLVTAGLLPTAQPLRECFSPLVLCIPAALYAAARADLLNEPYFRAFEGGRSPEGGGGISRIRTSNRIERPRK